MAKGFKFRIVDVYGKKMNRDTRGPMPTLKVGITKKTAERSHPKSILPVGDIAFYNEFGTMNIPARSFIRDWVDGNIDTLTKTLGNDLLVSLKSPTGNFSAALERRGKEFTRKIIRRIEKRIPPPNAPSTLAQKVGDIPLIDTETLIGSITHEVKKK